MINELLTIGNIVELHGMQHTVTGIEKSKAFDCDMITLDEWLRVEMSEIKGVVITDEWLKKLGFQEKRMVGIFDYKQSVIRFAPNHNLCELNDQLGKERNFDIQYVHQLQNLAYLLLGETLEMKL